MDSSSSSSFASPTRPTPELLHRETTYEYGIRPGLDKVLREIEQSKSTSSSLLVTRGHLELEVFTEPQNQSASSSSSSSTSLSSSWLHGSPVGTYGYTPAFTRPSTSSHMVNHYDNKAKPLNNLDDNTLSNKYVINR